MRHGTPDPGDYEERPVTVDTQPANRDGFTATGRWVSRHADQHAAPFGRESPPALKWDPVWFHGPGSRGGRAAPVSMALKVAGSLQLGIWQIMILILSSPPPGPARGSGGLPILFRIQRPVRGLQRVPDRVHVAHVRIEPVSADRVEDDRVRQFQGAERLF